MELVSIGVGWVGGLGDLGGLECEVGLGGLRRLKGCDDWIQVRRLGRMARPLWVEDRSFVRGGCGVTSGGWSVGWLVGRLVSRCRWWLVGFVVGW